VNFYYTFILALVFACYRNFAFGRHSDKLNELKLIITGDCGFDGGSGGDGGNWMITQACEIIIFFLRQEL
jgi:hypothetical protein